MTDFDPTLALMEAIMEANAKGLRPPSAEALKRLTVQAARHLIKHGTPGEAKWALEILRHLAAKRAAA